MPQACRDRQTFVPSQPHVVWTPLVWGAIVAGAVLFSSQRESLAQSEGRVRVGGEATRRSDSKGEVRLPGSPRPTSVRQTSHDGEPSNPVNPFTLSGPLEEVRIEGNTTIPNAEIAKHIKTRPGREVTSKQIKDDVEALTRTRWFASVEPSIRSTDDGNVLVYRVLERPIVRRVEYQGNHKIKTKAFEQMTQLKPGSPYDVSANMECVRRIEQLYKDKGYPHAKVELAKGGDRNDPDREVVFVIEEGPKVVVRSISFDGNKEFIDGILKTKTRTKTQILWLFGGKFDSSTVQDDIEGLRQYYYSLGYFDVQIEPDLQYSADGSKIDLHYKVDEGKRYLINTIEVEGQEVLAENDIRGMMKVASGEYYNARHIAKDVETIKAKYGEQGRLFAKVDVVPRWTEEPGIVDIVYRINEDKVWRVRNFNVHIAGDHPHTKQSLIRNISPIKPGDLADPRQIYLLKRRLEGSQYFETGPQLGPRIETNVVKNDDWLRGFQVSMARGQSSQDQKPNQTEQVTPTHHQRELGQSGHTTFAEQSLPIERMAPSARPQNVSSTDRSDSGSQNVAKPYFIGSNRSDDDEAAEESRAASSQRKLDPLAPITPIFRAQSRDPLKPPSNNIYDANPNGDPWGRAINDPDPNDWNRMPQVPPPDFIDIDAYLNEARTGRLMFGAGVNSNSGVVGNIVLSEQNFDILRPPTSWEDIWNGTAWRGAGQRFRLEAQPGTQVSRYLVDWQDPYFLDTNVNLGVSGFYFTRYYRDWNEQRLGGRIRLGQQFTQQLSGAVALRLEDVEVNNPRFPRPKLLSDAVGNNFLSTVRASLMHDTRDAAFLPTEGHYIEAGVEQAFLDYNYTRLELEARQYFTLYQRADGQGKHTLSLQGQASWSGDDTPIFERFYAGGFQSFRGFAFRGVSPVDTGVYVGGNWMALGSVEYMFPVTANEMVKLVAFSDFGTVSDKVSLSEFRMSVGGGIRLTIPAMGPVPIAFDWAVPIMKEDFDRRQIFSFYVGINR